MYKNLSRALDFLFGMHFMCVSMPIHLQYSAFIIVLSYRRIFLSFRNRRMLGICASSQLSNNNNKQTSSIHFSTEDVLQPLAQKCISIELDRCIQ